MSRTPLPGKGCFKASYPRTEWQEVPCATPRPSSLPRVGLGGPGPNAVSGAGANDIIVKASGTITTATGSFLSATNGIGENDSSNGWAETYSLQLNTNLFATSACKNSPNGNQCSGWQQFVFANSGGGPDHARVFMEYWLINYGPPATCPAGWSADLGSCFTNSEYSFGIPAQSLADLGKLVLTATAGSNGVDTLTLLTASGDLYAMASDSVLNLAEGWTEAEFNIYGDSHAYFGRGSAIAVKIGVDDGTATAPTFAQGSLTGESSNLMVAQPTCAYGGASPAVEFLESNAADATAACGASTLQAPAIMSSPANNSTLPVSATFQWFPGVDVQQYTLNIGSQPGASDIYGQNQGRNTSVTVSGLPTDGRALYVRLYSLIEGNSLYKDYSYVSSGGSLRYTIANVAGNGSFGYAGDNGPAAGAKLEYPSGVAVDAAGNLYIADAANNRIRKVSNGAIATVAGSGTAGFSGDDGPAAGAGLDFPSGVAVDAAGNLYIADTANNRIRKVSNGAITTVAGNGTAGYSGDNSPATDAQLNQPAGVAVDASGNLFIADTANNRIREVSGGAITTVAGNGTAGYSGDNGAATGAQLNRPAGVAVDASGNLFIADTTNNRIREVSGATITTIAGNGTAGYSVYDGPAIGAELNYPTGVAADASGAVYVADTGNNRVRVLSRSVVTCPASVTPSTLAAGAAGASYTVTIQTAPCGWAVQGLPSWIVLPGSASGTGPATITLIVAVNTGAERTATLTFGGASVQVIQDAPACSYSMSYGVEVFPAAGGAGSVDVTTGSSCSWVLARGVYPDLMSWVTNLGPLSAIGSATVTFQVAANPGAARSGPLSVFSSGVAGPTFAILQSSGNISGLTTIGSMAQIASGAGWMTTITLVNTGAASETVRLNFYDDKGNPLPLPFLYPQASSTSVTLASTLDEIIAPGALLELQTAGQSNPASVAGWAQVQATGSVSAFADFAWNYSGGEQEAIAPLETRNPTAFLLAFDNTGGYAEGIALANVTAQAANVPVVVRDDTGTVLASTSLSMAANGHAQFMLTDIAAAAAGARGTIEFDTPAGGQISVLGIRANTNGAVTSVPPGLK